METNIPGSKRTSYGKIIDFGMITQSSWNINKCYLTNGVNNGCQWTYNFRKAKRLHTVMKQQQFTRFAPFNVFFSLFLILFSLNFTLKRNNLFLLSSKLSLIQYSICFCYIRLQWQLLLEPSISQNFDAK